MDSPPPPPPLSLIPLSFRPYSPAPTASGQGSNQVCPEWSQHHVSWPHISGSQDGRLRPWRYCYCILICLAGYQVWIQSVLLYT